MELSVVVPVYNAKDYLKQCIDSILEQSYHDIELILVDDGSDDGSDKICDRYAAKDKRVKVLHQINSGPMISRKRGVESAEGRYVTFVDADDFVASCSFEYALPDMQKNIDIISFDIKRYYSESKIVVTQSAYEEGIYNADMIKRNVFPNMIWDAEKNCFGMDPSLCTKIIKRNILLNYYRTKLCKERIHYGEDVAVIYPIMPEITTLSIRHCAYYYHRRAENASMPSYILDHTFFDKLYFLYKYLQNIFVGKSVFQKQIDLFYMYSVTMKARQYGAAHYYLGDKIFPFDKIPKDSRVVLYGGGGLGKRFETQLNKISYCHLVVWVDKNYKNIGNESITDPEKIFQHTFDYIVIAIMNRKTRNEVVEWLMSRGVPLKKIIADSE